MRRLLARLMSDLRVRIAAVIVVLAVLASTVLVVRSGGDGGGDPVAAVGDGEVGVVVADEIKEIIGRNYSTVRLGGRSSEYKGGRVVLKGTPGATGLVAVTASGSPVAMAVAPKSGLFAFEEMPLDFRSTAVAQVLLTPGLLTGDGTVDALIEAVAYSLPEIDRIAGALRQEAQREGTLYLDSVDPSTRSAVDEALAALLDRIPTVLAGLPTPSTVPSPGTTDGTRIESAAHRPTGTSAGVATLSVHPGAALPAADGPERPALETSCDTGIRNYSGLERDNVCFSRTGGEIGETPATVQFTVENRSPRWVLVYLDKTEASIADIAASEAGLLAATVGSLVPDLAIAPKRWTLPGIVDLLGRFASALADSEKANGAKTVINLIPGVEIRKSDDSLGEQLNLKFREFVQNQRGAADLEVSSRTRMTTVAAGFPRSDGYSAYVSGAAPDELRRVVATTTTLITEVIVPVIRIVLDLKRPKEDPVSCGGSQDEADLALFAGLTEFTVEHADELGPFGRAVLGAEPGSYVDALKSTAPAALKAILTSSEPWTLIGRMLFSECPGDDPVSRDFGGATAAMAEMGVDPKYAESIATDYAANLVESKIKAAVKDALVEYLATMWSGWGTVIKVAEAAPEVANFAFGLIELSVDVWKYDTEDTYHFVDADGGQIPSPPWPQQAWSVSPLRGTFTEIRQLRDGNITLGSGNELVVIDPANGNVVVRYVLTSGALSAYGPADGLIWSSTSVPSGAEIRFITANGDPTVSASSFFGRTETIVLSKKDGTERLRLEGMTVVGDMIWNVVDTGSGSTGATVNIHDTKTMAVTATVTVPFVIDGFVYRLYGSSPTAGFSGANGEYATVDRSGKLEKVLTSGYDRGDGPYIHDQNDRTEDPDSDCSGVLSRVDGRLQHVTPGGVKDWVFPATDTDTVTQWSPTEDCGVHVGDDDGRIFRLDRNGRHKWSPEGVPLTNRLSPVSTIKISGDLLIVGSDAEKELFALDPGRGTRVWRMPLPDTVKDLLVAEDFMVVVLTTGQAIRVNTTSGRTSD